VRARAPFKSRPLWPKPLFYALIVYALIVYALKTLSLAVFFVALLIAPEKSAYGAAPIYKAIAAAEYDHDPGSFIQGLFFNGEDLYETSGLYGQSKIRRYRLNGEILAERKFEPRFFAEGAALAKGTIYVLTWKEGAVFLLDPVDLAVKEARFLPAESWGLTSDGETLWRSDGTNKLHRHNLDLSKSGPPLAVFDGSRPISGLNELEWDPISGLILANIYGDHKVVFIDPKSGQARHYLDCGDLVEKTAPKNPEAVLNGLALDGKGRLFLTGKLWPRTYQATWVP
jgi:glutamine cyclotransferase